VLKRILWRNEQRVKYLEPGLMSLNMKKVFRRICLGVRIPEPLLFEFNAENVLA